MKLFFSTVLGVLLASATPLIHAETVPLGTLVIAGGALRADTADVWQRIVALAGGKGARIAIVAAAAEDPLRSGAATVAIFKRYGAEAFVIPVAPLLAGADVRVNANDAAIAAQVDAAGGVFFTGGEQSRIVAALVEPDQHRSKVLEAIWAVYARGGVLAGSSAGAAIMSSTMFYQPADTLSVLKFGAAADKVLAPGLGFIGPQVFVDQHFLARGRFGRMLPAMQTAGYRLGLGIDENTAIAVTRQNEVEVLGESGVLLMDLRHASGTAAVRGVQLSYLERGDHLTLTTGAIKPSTAKLAGRRLDPAAPDYDPVNEEPQYYPNGLGHNVLQTLLSNLIDNPQREVIALAFGRPDQPEPQRGYEFRFRKSASAVGYVVNDPQRNRYTVLGIEMDMTPVRMQVPLYTKP